MQIILFNIQWMSFNISLAIIPVIFGWLLLQTKSSILKIVYGTIWLIFLPNTLYLLTDITHFISDWSKIALIYKGIFILEYCLLILFGVISFILGLYPLEYFIQKAKNKNKRQKIELFLYAVNFLIGFGIVLGRVERINSWDIVANTSKVIYETLYTFTSFNLLLLVVFFGLCSNVLYFTFQDLMEKTRR